MRQTQLKCRLLFFLRRGENRSTRKKIPSEDEKELHCSNVSVLCTKNFKKTQIKEVIALVNKTFFFRSLRVIRVAIVTKKYPENSQTL